MKLRLLFLALLPLPAFAQALSTRSGQAPAPDLNANPAAVVTPLNPALPTIFIAGDSTAAKNNGNPTQGWGAPFAGYFDATKVNIANRARGGRSSRTFITERLWEQLLGELKAGDYVLIQFGHNDGSLVNEEASVPRERMRSRGSLPGLGDESMEIDNVITGKHEVVYTFGRYMRRMIAEVKERGATPIVLSPTVRNIWKDGVVERGSGNYRQWDRELAQAAGIGFIDLTRLIADDYQQRGEEQVKTLFGADHTHTNIAGADLNAAHVVAGLKGIRKGPFGDLLSAKGEGIPADSIGWLSLPEPANPRLPSLVLIGDSTVRNGRGDGDGGQWGWGDYLGTHFDPAKVNVVNRAVGGLSSRTFLTQGHWQRVLTLVKPGDYVVMQFGHNDNGPLNDATRARGTIKGTGEETEEIDNLLTKQHEVVHSYGWYLTKFIRETRAKGAIPVVCSLVPRKTWKDGRIVRSAEGYAGWAKAVATQQGAAFIDLNEAIAAHYEGMDAKAVDALFADAHTHTSQAGAELNASIVADGLRALPGDPLAAYAAK